VGGDLGPGIRNRIWAAVVSTYSKRSVEGRPLEDAALVERARNGDVNAYEDLVQRYQELAFRVAYHLTGNAADAEDAAQEAFVNAYYALDRFRRGAPFRPWLLRIVANEARNRRASATRRMLLAERAQAAHTSGEAAPSPESEAEAAELRATLAAALQRLRAEDRLILAYRLFFDLSESEMAEALSCPKGTVKSRLSRALARLRAVLPADLRRSSASEGING
jgi:RNA polymerase sigma-70 factor, ECF subfamily